MMRMLIMDLSIFETTDMKLSAPTNVADQETVYVLSLRNIEIVKELKCNNPARTS